MLIIIKIDNLDSPSTFSSSPEELEEDDAPGDEADAPRNSSRNMVGNCPKGPERLLSLLDRGVVDNDLERVRDVLVLPLGDRGGRGGHGAGVEVVVVVVPCNHL